MILNSPYITGSITVTGNANVQGTLTVTGSLSGTATSASLALNSNLLQGTGSVGFATTASLLEVSSSQQQISASLLNVIANYATTGSNSFRADQSITGSLVVSSTITAQTLVVQTVTSSIVYSSGSNIFGSALTDRQTFTGSVNITGSLTVNTTGTEFQVTNAGVVIGNLLTDNHSITGSLRVTGSSNHSIMGSNLGIGNVSPTVRLQVSGTFAVGDDNNGWGRIVFDSVTNTTRIQSSKNGTDSVGLSFWTQESGGGFAERMLISGSNVGIGTSSPLSQATGQTTGILDVSAAAGGNLVLHRNGSGDTALFSILKASNGTYIDSTGAATAANNAIIFRVNNTNGNQTTVNTALRIESDRKVVVNADDNGIILRAATANQSIYYEWQNSSSTRRGYIGFGGSSSSTFDISNNEDGAIKFRANGAERASIYNTYASTGYSTLQVGTGTTAKIMITGNTGATGDCNVSLYGGVGSNAITGAAFFQLRANDSNAWLFQINASNQYQSWYNNGSTWSAVGYQTTGGTWTNSDERRKTNIEDLEYGLKDILQLKPKKFNFKHDTEVGNIKQKDMGFIAQEVLPIMPLAVDSGMDGEEQYYSMNYANMIPVLVKAIQELKATNDDLQAQINELKER
jgi:hypothetical protein